MAMNLTRKVLCLDWDKRSLRIVLARVGGGRAVLEDAHSHRMPNTVESDDPEQMGDFIRQMLRRHRMHQKRVVVDVPREKAVINRLAMPPTPPEEVANAVRFQAMKELPFPVDSAAIDYVVMERDADGLATEVLLAAVTLETLERVRATCEAAGLTPTRIGLRPYANLVSVQKVLEISERRVLFVDVGPGATEIDVMHGDGLAFARSANVNVPQPAATEHREDSRIISIADLAGLDGADEAIEAAGEELVVEVMRTLQAYRATEADATIDLVVVAGGTGIETQLADQLRRRLGYPVELFDPSGPLGVDPGEAPKLRSFSAALGLAWGLSREGLLALDFLNPKRPISAREIMRRRVRLATLGAVALLIIAVGSLTWHVREQVAIRNALRTQNETTWELVKAKREVANKVDEVREWQVEAVWPEELLTLTQLAVDPGKKMVVRQIDLDIAARKPHMALRDVYVTEWQVANELVRAVSELEVEGERPYEATQGAWTEVPGGLTFTGNTDVRIELRSLQKFRDGAEKREKQRKEQLKKL